MSTGANQGPAGRVRVGLRFDKPPASSQASLDRYVFARMKRKARAKQADQTEEKMYSERRMATRIEVGAAERISARILPTMALGVVARAQPAPGEGQLFEVFDISTTGCSLLCDDQQLFQPRKKIRFHLQGEELDMELTATVIYSKELGDE